MLHILISLLTLFGMDNPKKGTLVVEIKGIEVTKGTVNIGIYNRADGFANNKAVYIGKVVAVKGNTVKVALPNLPHGDYAIAAFHDKNANGKLDKGLFGVPTELYGFSNNARGTFGPPKFSEAKFNINSSTQKISFKLK
jgi:uncharacterized protein (DUF2141 family)